RKKKRSCSKSSSLNPMAPNPKSCSAAIIHLALFLSAWSNMSIVLGRARHAVESHGITAYNHVINAKFVQAFEELLEVQVNFHRDGSLVHPQRQSVRATGG